MCYVVSYGILIWKGRYVLYRIFILQLEVKNCLEPGALFEHTKHWHSLLCHAWHPPAHTGVAADIISKLFFKCIGALRQMVLDPFVWVDEFNPRIDLPHWQDLRWYAADKIDDLVHPLLPELGEQLGGGFPPTQRNHGCIYSVLLPQNVE